MPADEEDMTGCPAKTKKSLTGSTDHPDCQVTQGLIDLRDGLRLELQRLESLLGTLHLEEPMDWGDVVIVEQPPIVPATKSTSFLMSQSMRTDCQPPEPSRGSTADPRQLQTLKVTQELPMPRGVSPGCCSLCSGDGLASVRLKSSNSHASHASFLVDVEDYRAQMQAQTVQTDQDRTNREKAETGEFNTRNTSYLQSMTRGNRFEACFALVILLSAVLSGAEAQYSASHIGQEEPIHFVLARAVFSFIFVFELVFRFSAEGCKYHFSSDKWQWTLLDIFVAVISVFETALDVLLLVNQSGEGKGLAGVDTLRIVKMIRITRLARAVRLQRIVRFFASLRTLVYSIAVTLKSLVWSMVLLLMIIYVFGIAFTEYTSEFRAHESDPGVTGALEDYFGSLDRSMFTLFQTISGGISWREAVTPLHQVSIFMPWLYSSFVAFVTFAVLNVVTGVFCSSAIETAQKNPDLVARSVIERERRYAVHLKQLFSVIDKDGSGLITVAEFEHMMSDEMTRAYFAALEIELHDAWTIFKLLDHDRGGAIAIDEFIQGCKMLRGGATSVQVTKMSTDLRNLAKKMMRFMLFTEKQFENLGIDCTNSTTTALGMSRGESPFGQSLARG